MTALTRLLRAHSSLAQVRVSERRAALVAAYVDRPQQVEVLFGDRVEDGDVTDAGIGENDVQAPARFCDRRIGIRC
jgi:hypothetical protein